MECAFSFFPTLSNQPLSWWASGMSGFRIITEFITVESDLPPKSETFTPLIATTGFFDPSNSSASELQRVQVTTLPDRSTRWISRLLSLRLVVLVVMEDMSVALLQTPITSNEQQNLWDTLCQTYSCSKWTWLIHHVSICQSTV